MIGSPVNFADCLIGSPISSQSTDTDGLAAEQAPVIKQRRLGEIVGAAATADGVQAAIDAVVAHAFAATTGERELFQIVDVASGFTESIYDERHAAKVPNFLYF